MKHHIWELIFLLAIVVGVLSLNCVATACSAHTVDQSDSDKISAWIRNQQFTNTKLSSFGAIKVHSTPAVVTLEGMQYCRISPYIGNLAVIGLLDRGAQFRLQVAERWITWFLAHLKPKSAPDGVPYEHFYLADGAGETTCVVPGDPRLCSYNDATDSAAATFFHVLIEYVTSGGNSAILTTLDRKQQIERMAASLLALQQSDGLMWAKSKYRVKYLEDNCEVYDGLRSLALLEKAVYKDGAETNKYSQAADRVQHGILAELYNASSKRWIIAKQENGNRPAVDVNRWYPDMQAQLWPQLWGVVSASDDRTRTVMGTLNSIWNGSTPGCANWATNPQAVNGGWINADAAFAALIGGDKDRVGVYLSAVRTLKYSASPSQFGWPFTIADAGWLLRILAKTEK